MLSQYGFAYVDHSLVDRSVVPKMLALTEGERGIPVVVLNGQVTVGFDRRQLQLGLGIG